ncbi:MAG: group II truncated hemoglobin [Gammaproteobacteria bacterium]|nr:group II truncated hemoglobin [Gammaproteobacteria bacterium]
MNKAAPPDENYGFEDTSYRAAGEFDGIQKLVKCFYQFMDELPEAGKIRSMHAADLSVIDDKLTHFLCYWLGGPRQYRDKYGPISIPKVHMHLTVGESERDAWLLCMQRAAELQPYKPSFKKYLLEQLALPAERIRATSRNPIK